MAPKQLDMAGYKKKSRKNKNQKTGKSYENQVEKERGEEEQPYCEKTLESPRPVVQETSVGEKVMHWCLGNEPAGQSGQMFLVDTYN